MKNRFETGQNRTQGGLKKFAVIFGAVMLLVAAAGIFILLRHYDYDLSGLSSGENESSTQESVSEPVPEVSGITNILLLCTSDAGNKLRYASVLTVDLDDLTLSLSPLNTNETVSTPECVGDLEAQLDFGGAKQLVSAVETTTGCVINKYIRCRDSGFRAIMNSFGPVSVNVTKKLDVRDGELIAIFNTGVQDMTGDVLLKYLRCYEDNPRRQCEILALIFRQKLTKENLVGADDKYDLIINRVESDISAFDFVGMKPAFEALTSSDSGVRVTVNF